LYCHRGDAQHPCNSRVCSVRIEPRTATDAKGEKTSKQQEFEKEQRPERGDVHPLQVSCQQSRHGKRDNEYGKRKHMS
jgi:hypothetical protein